MRRTLRVLGSLGNHWKLHFYVGGGAFSEAKITVRVALRNRLAARKSPAEDLAADDVGLTDVWRKVLGAHIVRQRPNWRFTTYPTGALPHFELPARFNADLQAFLSKA